MTTLTDVPARHGGSLSIYLHIMRAFRKFWNARLLAAVGTPLLYLGGLGFGMGALVNANSGGIDGLPYAVFVAPGVMCATAMQVVMSEVTYPVIGGIKWHRTYHGMIATPLEPKHIVRGTIGFAAFSSMLVCSLYLLVAWLFGTLTSPLAPLSLVTATLGGLALGIPVMAYAATLDNDQGLTVVFRFIVMPLSLFSATFFPLSQLPGWTHPIAYATPLWHAVEASRDLTTGRGDWAAVGGHTAVLLAYCLVGYLLALRTMRRRLIV